MIEDLRFIERDTGTPEMVSDSGKTHYPAVPNIKRILQMKTEQYGWIDVPLVDIDQAQEIME